MLDEPPVIIDGKRTTAAISVAALTWITWDAIISIGNEVEFIWSRPGSAWFNWAYASIRWLPILHGGIILVLSGDRTFSPSVCKAWVIEQMVAIETLTLLVEIVLVLRVRILYNYDRKVLSAVLVAFLVEIIVMMTTLGLTIPNQTSTPDCLVARSPRIFIAYWLSSLLFETLLFVLTLMKFFKHIAAHGNRRGSILYIFMRDGTWAFALIFAALLLNTLLYQLVHTPVAGSGYFEALSVMSFTGSHVLLNMRKISVPQAQDTLPTIQFSSSPSSECTTGEPSSGVGLQDAADGPVISRAEH